MQQRRVLMATSVSYVVVILDTTIVNVALEKIAAGPASDVAGLQWVVNAYTLSFASLLLIGGTLCDRLGARNVYIASLAVFTIASALCGFAPSLPALIAARVLQGVGAALLVPASMTLINHTWPDPRERAGVFGLWAGLGGVAMASGPLLGGVLVGLTGWRSIFLINVPICSAGMAMARRVRAERSAATPSRFDFAGQCAAIAALGLRNVTVIQAPLHGWDSPMIIGGMTAALAAAGVFVMIETSRAQPMLPIALFRSGIFSGAVFVSMVSAFTFYGFLFDLSLYFQQQRGYTPMQAGLAFLPLTVLVPIGSLVSKRAVAWLGLRRLVGAALILAAGGFSGLAVAGAAAPYGLLAASLPAIGLAASLITPATTAALMASVDSQRAGIAAGVLNAARQTGAALGVACFGALISVNRSFAAGMHMGLLAAAMLSMVASVVWWCALTPNVHTPELAPGENG